MALTNDQVLTKIEQLHADNPFDEHPLWAGLIAGSYSLAQVREFAQQFGIIPLHNHNYHGPIYVNCPDPKWREMIAEVVYEEGTGRLYANGVPHNQLYIDFSEGLGLTREDLLACTYCPGGLGWQGWYQDRCNGTFLEAVSAHMLAAEAHGPGVFRHLAQTFKDKFGLDDKGVAFWVVHDVADEDHSGIGKQLLDQFATTEEDRQQVLSVVSQTLEMTFHFYDDVQRVVDAA